MSTLAEFVDCWAERYDTSTYSRAFYLALLDAARSADGPDCLARTLELGLHWKDAKVREDSGGSVLLGGCYYTVAAAKPNSYSREKHGHIMLSNEFYEWAVQVRSLHEFSLGPLRVIRERFRLWDTPSVVLPTFVLHLLQPGVFPIFDRRVDLARRWFVAETGPRDLSAVKLNDSDYLEYVGFWQQFLADLAIDPFARDYAELKRVDEALWSFGRALRVALERAGLTMLGGETQEEQTVETPGAASEKGSLRDNTVIMSGSYSTTSPEFQERVLELIGSGSMTQREAMEKAAAEYGVHLKPSYLAHPGSHVYRWRHAIQRK